MGSRRGPRLCRTPEIKNSWGSLLLLTLFRGRLKKAPFQTASEKWLDSYHGFVSWSRIQDSYSGFVSGFISGLVCRIRIQDSYPGFVSRIRIQDPYEGSYQDSYLDSYPGFV